MESITTFFMGLSRDEQVKLIQQRSEQLGVRLKDVSIAAGKNKAYLSQFCTLGSPDKLPEEVRAVVCKMLEIDEHLLAPHSNLTGPQATAISREMHRLASEIVYAEIEKENLKVSPGDASEAIIDVLDENRDPETLKKDGPKSARMALKHFARK